MPLFNAIFTMPVHIGRLALLKASKISYRSVKINWSEWSSNSIPEHIFFPTTSPILGRTEWREIPTRAAGYIGYVRYIDIISTGIQDLTISFISICVKMVSFPLKRLQRLPWRLWARPLPLPLCLSERACAKTPHSRPRRPLTTQQAWMIPVKKTRRRRETKLFQRGETTAP